MSERCDKVGHGVKSRFLRGDKCRSADSALCEYSLAVRFVGQGDDFVFAEEMHFVLADDRAASYCVDSYFVLLALCVVAVSAEGQIRACFFFFDRVGERESSA